MKKLILLSICVVCTFGLLYLLAFHVGNTDFWWHIKAGQILRSSGWITTDPFAYTRIGEPYLATHPWLAQVILSQVFDVGGWVGITVLRIILITLTFGIPLLLDKKRYWLYAPLALLAVAGARPSLSDRPQLFTFLFFAITLALCFSYLDISRVRKNQIAVFLPLSIAVWSNLHGAAALSGIAVIGALFVSRLIRKDIDLLLLASLIASCVALLLTPSGFANINYVIGLFSDTSASLISEWQAAPLSEYLRHTAPLWIAALGSIFFVKKEITFNSLLLIGIGYLSLQAGRHEILFLITALTVFVYQMRQIEVLETKKILAGVLSTSIFVTLFAVLESHRYTTKEDTFGFGLLAPMADAATYVNDQNLTGNMFNNYNAGGELLYHGHNVFLDGRNVDYGYDYIKRAVDAGVDQNIWSQLEDEYQFTHAVIYYSLEGSLENIPYIHILDRDRSWSLTYLDEWAAVYEKNTANPYFEILTPKMLYDREIPSEISLGDLQTLDQELRRVIEKNPRSNKAKQYHQDLIEAFAS